jgi:hypothetical protein
MKKIILGLGIAGTLFAGYLSAAKLLAKTCAFGETCQAFLGYPACYFGFALFLLITSLAGLMLLNKIKEERGFSYIAFVSFVGVLFAGYFTLQEVPRLWAEGFSAYFFKLPTCAWGLIFFALIFGLSIRKVMEFED